MTDDSLRAIFDQDPALYDEAWPPYLADLLEANVRRNGLDATDSTGDPPHPLASAARQK